MTAKNYDVDNKGRQHKTLFVAHRDVLSSTVKVEYDETVKSLKITPLGLDDRRPKHVRGNVTYCPIYPYTNYTNKIHLSLSAPVGNWELDHEESTDEYFIFYYSEEEQTF